MKVTRTSEGMKINGRPGGRDNTSESVRKYCVMLVEEASWPYKADAPFSVLDPDNAAKAFNALLGLDMRPQECFAVMALDTKGRPTGVALVAQGILSQTMVDPREVFRFAITANAASVILAHNHPSGDPEPSGMDVDVTQRLSEAGEILGVKVVDHLVIGRECHVSMASRGFIGE